VDGSPVLRQARDADGQDYAGTPRPDAIVPVLDKNQLAVLGKVGREWDRTSAGPRTWRQALPVDPALGEYPEAGELRPAGLLGTGDTASCMTTSLAGFGVRCGTCPESWLLACLST
jgi:hypothetical protein